MALFSGPPSTTALVEADHAMLVDAAAAPGGSAGLRALQLGGSAADAVLTTALTNIAITLGAPITYAGIATLIYYDAATGRVQALDAGGTRCAGRG